MKEYEVVMVSPEVGTGGGGEAGGWEKVVNGPGKGILLEGP